MATDKPTPADLSRWLTHPSGEQLPFPQEFQNGTERGRAGFEAWVRMHRASDELALAEHQYGVASPPATRWRMKAREAREELLFVLDIPAEELQAQYSLHTERGRNALALGRY